MLYLYASPKNNRTPNFYFYKKGYFFLKEGYEDNTYLLPDELHSIILVVKNVKKGIYLKQNGWTKHIMWYWL